MKKKVAFFNHTLFRGCLSLHESRDTKLYVLKVDINELKTLINQQHFDSTNNLNYHDHNAMCNTVPNLLQQTGETETIVKQQYSYDPHVIGTVDNWQEVHIKEEKRNFPTFRKPKQDQTGVTVPILNNSKDDAIY